MNIDRFSSKNGIDRFNLEVESRKVFKAVKDRDDGKASEKKSERKPEAEVVV